MRLKKHIPLEKLVDFGFQKSNLLDHGQDETIMQSDYVLEIGHIKRGQYAYLLVEKFTRELIFYCTQIKMRTGGSIVCPDVLIVLATAGYLEPSKK